MTKHSIYTYAYFMAAVSIFFGFGNAQGSFRAKQRELNNRSSISKTFSATGDTIKEPGNNIWCIFQDRSNRYWFGSDGEGVYRYDGKTTIHFTKKHGLCDNQVRDIQEDRSGNIYINTLRGISKFDGQVFSTLHIIADSASVNEWKLGPDDLWFKGAQDSGVVYRYDGKALHRLEFPKTKLGEEFKAKYPRSEYPSMTFSPYDVYTIYKDSKGSMWFGTGNLGACCYDGKSFTWISGDDLTEFGDGPGNGVRSVIEDKVGKFWFSNTRHRYKIYRISPLEPIKNVREKGIGSLDGRNEGDLYDYVSATKDASGDLWIVTYHAGAWRYDGKKTIHYPVRDGGKMIALLVIYKDRQGGLWLGTDKTGIYKFNGKTFGKFKF